MKSLIIGLILALLVTLSYSQSLDQTHIDFYNPLTNGVSCDSTTLAAALNAVGTKQRTVFLTATDRNKVECTWDIRSNITTPVNVRLLIPFGVKANISSGVTLTVNGCLDAQDPNWQTGAGSIVQTGICVGDVATAMGSMWFSFVYDGCLHPTAIGSSATIPKCSTYILDSASLKLNPVSITTPTEITYTGGDGRYWIIVKNPAVEEPSGWDCVTGTPYCVKKNPIIPPIPANTILIVRTDVVSGAITNTGDASTRIFNRPVTYNVDSVTADESHWIFLPGGSLTYTGRNIVHNGSVTAMSPGVFRSGGTGRIKFGVRSVVDPAWFVSGGSGTDADPWTSADNCGGWCEAMASVQFLGNMRSSSGVYRFASSIPASFDLPVNSADGQISIDMTESVIQTTSTGTVFKFNKNGVLSDTSTNLHTIHIYGGIITTQLHGVLSNDAPIIGIGIDCNRTRNTTINQMRFLGLEKGIIGNISDTLTISNNVFRRNRHSIFFENNAAIDVPQDIYISENTGSVTNGPNTPGILDGSTFITIENRVDNVNIFNNGMANSTENARFIKIMTGDETGNSSNITISQNATEQYSTGSKLVEISRFGSTIINNVRITRNAFSSPLGPTTPPFANGQPALDLSYVAGHLVIEENAFTNSSVTAIKLDNFRPINESNPASSSGIIQNNTFEQFLANNGRQFEITTVIGSGTRLIIGRNGSVPFYGGTFPANVYPDIGVQFITGPSYTANIVAAPTITISPWDDYIEINGTTIITDVTPTWHGHNVCMMFETANGGMDRSATLFVDVPFRSRIPNESVICIRYDGNLNLWREVSRSSNLTFFDFVAAPTATINAAATIVNVTGSGTVNTITVARSGQRVTLQCQTITGVVFTDSAPPYSSGNMNLTGNFTCDAVGKTLTIIPNNAVWFEDSRSAP